MEFHIPLWSLKVIIQQLYGENCPKMQQEFGVGLRIEFPKDSISQARVEWIYGDNASVSSVYKKKRKAGEIHGQ